MGPFNDVYLVGRLLISRRGEVAADPGGQASSGVGPNGQLGPVERAEGGVPPVQISASVRRQVPRES